MVDLPSSDNDAVDGGSATVSSSGLAGRTNYRSWEEKTSKLIEEIEQEEEKENQQNSAALGLGGKYASSLAEAEEREKAKKVKQAKNVIERYKKRESLSMQILSNVLEESSSSNVARVTRDKIGAGRRVFTLSETTGLNPTDSMIVLSQDLNHLQSSVPVNSRMKPKSYQGDAENDVVVHAEEKEEYRTVQGLIKVFIEKVKNCTIVIRCKIISGTVEMNHCENVVLRIEKDATVATLQTDLCKDVTVEFCDAPSGKNTSPHPSNKLYWGDDKDDRIFHAGVSNMTVKLVRDDFVDDEINLDYEKDGAVSVGNASPLEYQFVTSVVDGKLTTESVVRNGASTGKNSRAMTERELKAEQDRRDKAIDMAMSKAVKITTKDGKEVPKVSEETSACQDTDEVVEEVYASMSQTDIDSIVADCEANKAKGNEAFSAGEYFQAVLLYTLALDKADELPDKDSGKSTLFARHIVLSNRSACFLKLGEHEKALADATRSEELEPSYVKSIFRRGLALHALARYQEALPVLARAQKLEPKNKQIKQALQFCEVRLTQEMRERMGK